MVQDLTVNSFQRTQIDSQFEVSDQNSVGSLAGYSLSVSDSPLSLIADAAEELTFGLDNTEELDLKERKEKKPAETLLLEKVRLYQEMMTQADGDRRPAADTLIRFLRNQADLSRLSEQVREFHPDPTDAWASLLEARDLLAREGAPAETLAAIDRAVTQLEADLGPEIRAGFAAVLARAGFESLGPAGEMRDDYRQAVIDFPDTAEMFEFILEKYGENDFDAALDYLNRALANDLAADSPSHDGVHLEAVAANLGQVRIINSAHSLCQRLMNRWQEIHGVADCQLTAMALVKEILALKKENFISASRIDRIVSEARPPDIEGEVLFLQELLNTSRGLAAGLFDRAENRLKFIAAVQESLDSAITREDEYLASLE
ncbi:MAG: type III secretion system gatekeeper subunit SctW [Deltaproteobacteria bacterium]|jgi:type III secretion protein W|nr:type III secretion system gatekeeper subunit SctW [Deltaproteobacteria bacterium]